jgi:ribonuclease G
LETLEALEGQDIVVQVSQEQRAEKGARLTRFLRLVGTYLVYSPYGNEISISNKIEDEEIRDRLVNVVAENMGEGGFTIRTSAKDANIEDILEEGKYLVELFEEIINKAKTSKSPCLLYFKDNIVEDVILRQNTELKKIVVNNHLLEEYLSRFADVEYDKDVFETNGVSEMIADALKKEIKLNCGGRVIIEETKAFVSIDVDSGEGSSQGGFNKLNNEASIEIAKQIILRNLSGKIIIDFAGISEYKFLKNSIDILERELSEDVCNAKVLGLSRAGNVEIIRNRRRPTLQDLFSEECPTCRGTGRVER